MRMSILYVFYLLNFTELLRENTIFFKEIIPL